MKNISSLLILTAIAGTAVVLPSDEITPRPGAYGLKRIPSSAVHHRAGTASPRIRIKESTSSNWSGYAVPLEATKSDTFSEAVGSWVVPGVTGTAGKATYSSSWVGIDGYSSGSVEQTGTEQDWTGSGAEYYAWFEMYPAGGYEITGFPVKAGDVITASVTFKGTTTVKSRGRTKVEDVFTLIIANTTENVSYTVPSSYTTIAAAARSSAEWIEEAPSSGRVLPIADFGTVGFSGCEAVSVNSGNSLAPIGSGVWTPDPLTMEDGTSGVATPSGLDSTKAGFTVTWTP